MKHVVTVTIGLAFFTLFALVLSQRVSASDTATASGKANIKTPTDRVVVMYFHRTQRCPTCLKMGSYSEEAVTKGFANEVKAGTVEFHSIDFQDAKNAAMVKAYKIGGPTLIVLKVEKNKAVAGKNLTEIWTKARDKDVFLKYVQDHIAALQKPLPETARKLETNTSAARTN
ncbi:MAG: hypothetical protein JW829_16180 [Pirellulales bacterium]|nr:hypothetical protein [Pirellulales bacterium]